MSEEIENMERVFSTLGEQYPHVKRYMDMSLELAKESEKAANLCQFKKTLTSYGAFVFYLYSTRYLEKLNLYDDLNLIDIYIKFRSHIENILKEKCGCR